jgi:hypothetical protein
MPVRITRSGYASLFERCGSGDIRLPRRRGCRIRHLLADRVIRSPRVHTAGVPLAVLVAILRRRVATRMAPSQRSRLWSRPDHRRSRRSAVDLRLSAEERKSCSMIVKHDLQRHPPVRQAVEADRAHRAPRPCARLGRAVGARAGDLAAELAVQQAQLEAAIPAARAHQVWSARPDLCRGRLQVRQVGDARVLTPATGGRRRAVFTACAARHARRRQSATVETVGWDDWPLTPTFGPRGEDRRIRRSAFADRHQLAPIKGVLARRGHLVACRRHHVGRLDHCSSAKC